MKNKWVKTGVNVYNRITRNQPKEMVFTYRKAKQQQRQRKIGLKWVKEKQTWHVDDQMKEMMNQESEFVMATNLTLVPFKRNI